MTASPEQSPAKITQRQLLESLSANPSFPDWVEEAGGYEAILASKDKKVDLQDALDSMLQSRLIDVRNQLRARGFDGADRKPVLHKFVDGHTLSFSHIHEQVGAGRNLVSSTFIIRDITDPANPRVLASQLDKLESLPEDFAAELDAAALQALRQPVQAPASTELGAFAPQHRAVLKTVAIHDDVVEAIMRAGGYLAVLANKEQLPHFAKILDSTWGRRIVDIRNQARVYGFAGDQHASVLRRYIEGRYLDFSVEHEAFGANNDCVGATFVITDVTDRQNPKVLASHQDTLTWTADNLVCGLNTAALEVIRGHAKAPAGTPAPAAVEPQADPAETMQKIHELVAQAKALWDQISESDRQDLCDANYPGTTFAEALESAQATSEEVVQSLTSGPRP